MKICYLDQYFKTREMAGGTRGYEMARRLVRRGHHVVVVTTDWSLHAERSWRVSEVEGIEVHRKGIPYSNEMSFHQRARSFFRFAMAAGLRAASVGGDLVFATSTPLTIALPAVFAKWRMKVPMVFEVRDLWPELPIAIGALRNPITRMAARSLERFAYRHSDRIIALSPGMKDGVASTGYPGERISVIPNSSDIDLFGVSEEAGLRWRKQHPEIGDRKMLLYAGTIGRMNGVDWLVRLAAEVRKMSADVCLVIAGHGAEMSDVTRLARERGLLNESVFVIPNVPKKDMAPVVSAATVCSSVFIDLEAMWHNSANKFFDALAGSRPVVINYGGWQSELLSNSGAGLTLPVGDIPLAARQLVEHMDDSAWLCRASAAAGKLAAERFNRETLAIELENVLTEAAQEGRLVG